MKNVTLTLWALIMLSFFSASAYAQAERTNHYTQVTVYFAMNSLTEEYDAGEYMKNHIFAQAWIKTIMERTDTTMNIH